MPMLLSSGNDAASAPFELCTLWRLPRPLLLTLVPWWSTLLPATLAIADGRPGRALLLLAGSAIVSVLLVLLMLLIEAASPDRAQAGWRRAE